MKILKGGHRSVSSGRTDGRTGKHDEAYSHFSQILRRSLKLLTVLSPPVLGQLIPLTAKYLPQHTALKYSQNLCSSFSVSDKVTPMKAIKIIVHCVSIFIFFENGRQKN